jgi:hypothetical protein
LPSLPSAVGSPLFGVADAMTEVLKNGVAIVGVLADPGLASAPLAPAPAAAAVGKCELDTSWRNVALTVAWRCTPPWPLSY